MRQTNTILMAAMLLAGAELANAAPVQLASGDVVIGYDLDNFSLNVDGVTYDSSAFSITPVANGVRLGFNGHLNVYASSYFTLSPETKTADYSALFSLAPVSGKSITGFNIIYSGGYTIETPGSASASGVGMFAGGSTGGGPFSITSNFSGASVPNLTGQLSATGEIGYVDVLDGFQTVFVGYQQVLDFCEPDNPDICHYHDEPLYQQVPVYRQEMDLGEASIFIDSITIAANVAPVPVPPSALLFLSGLLGLGVQKIRHGKCVRLQEKI